MIIISKQKHIVSVVFLLVINILAGCAQKPDEEQIQVALNETEKGIRSRNTSETIEYLAEDFVAESSGHGVMDREQVRKLLTGIYFKHKSIQVAFTGVEIKFSDTENRYATVTFRAFAAGGRGGILPDTGQAYRVSTEWRKSDGNWEMISAKAKRALEQ